MSLIFSSLCGRPSLPLAGRNPQEMKVLDFLRLYGAPSLPPVVRRPQKLNVLVFLSPCGRPADGQTDAQVDRRTSEFCLSARTGVGGGGGPGRLTITGRDGGSKNSASNASTYSCEDPPLEEMAERLTEIDTSAPGDYLGRHPESPFGVNLLRAALVLILSP